MALGRLLQFVLVFMIASCGVNHKTTKAGFNLGTWGDATERAANNSSNSLDKETFLLDDSKSIKSTFRDSTFEKNRGRNKLSVKVLGISSSNYMETGNDTIFEIQPKDQLNQGQIRIRNILKNNAKNGSDKDKRDQLRGWMLLCYFLGLLSLMGFAYLGGYFFVILSGVLIFTSLVLSLLVLALDQALWVLLMEIVQFVNLLILPW